MQTLFLYAAPAANNFLVCLRLPAKTLFYTCTQFFFSIFSFSNHFFSINFPSLPRQSKNNGSSLRTIKHTTGDLSTYLSLFIFCRTNMTKITSKAILCSTRSMQSSWQLSCWFKWILRTIYQHQCMSQTSKLLCWFLSTPPPLWGNGVTQQSFIWGGGGGSAPRSPPLTLLYTPLEGKVRPSWRSLPICAIIGITLRVSALPLVPETFYARFPVSAFCRRFVGLQLTPSPLHALEIRQSPGYPKNVPNTVPRKMLKSAFKTTSIM